MSRYNILSLDGGGIRGIITAIWLESLENKLDRPLTDCFDLIAGTSTGSILACAIAMGMPATRIVELYEKQGEVVFPSAVSRWWNRWKRVFSQGPSAPKYDGCGLEFVLKKCFGEDTTLCDLPAIPSVLIPVYDINSGTGVVVKGNKVEHLITSVWSLVKASCSAPTFFPSHQLEIDGETFSAIDGGVVANNPAVCAIAEGIKYGMCPRDIFVASLGTGRLPDGVTSEQGQEWGALEWMAGPLINILTGGPSDATDYVAKQIVGNDNYCRLQTTLPSGHGSMDDASHANIKWLKDVAYNYLSSDAGREQMLKLIDTLSFNGDKGD